MSNTEPALEPNDVHRQTVGLTPDEREILRCELLIGNLKPVAG